MSRAYTIFVGNFDSQAVKNRNAAVIEHSGTFPLTLPIGYIPNRFDLRHLPHQEEPCFTPRFRIRWYLLEVVVAISAVVEVLPKLRGARIIKKTRRNKPREVPLTFKMEQLPVELRRAVLVRLDLQTTKALRLTSKAWAALGEEYLISNHFQTLPHRPDTDRLKSLSEHSKFSHRIQRITFNHGEVNEYHARHNTYFMLYTRDPEERANEMNACWGSYGPIKDKKEQYLPGSCDRQVLTDIFGRLSHLRAIHIKLMENPFEKHHSELLRSLWSMPSTRHLPRVATTERFTDVLAAVAANTSTISLKQISHDKLPFEFFAQKESTLSLFNPILESITHLELTINYSDMPNNLHAPQAFERLAMFLTTASSLQSLHLEFQGRRKIDISLFLSCMADSRTFLDLKQIRLGGIIASEFGLGDFLVRQKNSLRYLRLGGDGVRAKHTPPNGGVHLSSGTFSGLFTRLRKEMKLDSLKVQGDLVGLESGERWIIEVAEDEKNLGEYVTD